LTLISLMSPSIVLPSASISRPTLASGLKISMVDEPKVSFDNDMSKWKPDPKGPGGADMTGKALHAGNFESTDTPDFFRDDDYGKDISIMDGVLGSSVQNVKKERRNPGLEGALEVNPDVYTFDEVMTDVSTVDFGLSTDIKMTDMDFNMVVDSTTAKGINIDVRPVMMTYEEFYCGLTRDSHPSFSVSPVSGKMEKRGGAPTTVTVTCKPNGASGELCAWLCFILPDEKAFSTYYKITAKAL